MNFHWILLYPPQSRYSINAYWVNERKYINLFQNFIISFIKIFFRKDLPKNSFGSIFGKEEGRIKGLRVFYFQPIRTTASNCVLVTWAISQMGGLLYLKYIFLFSKEAYLVLPPPHLLLWWDFSLLFNLFHKCNSWRRKLPTVLPHQLSLVFCVPFPVLIS